MRVKRFVGENVAETMGKVKKELGSDAVILQTRQFKEGGIFGFFGKVKVEITAAIEELPPVKKFIPPVNPYKQFEEQSELSGRYASALSINPNPNNGVNHNYNTDSNLNFSNSRINSGTNISAGYQPNKKTEPETKPGEAVVLQEEIVNMRLTLEKMNKHIEELSGERVSYPYELGFWAGRLRERGISEKLIKRMMHSLQQNLREDEWKDQNLVFSSIKEEVIKLCNYTNAIQLGNKKPCVVALIGPTGVGKTTTIGKLAASFSIVDKRKVALITADTYRVAAVEQLKTFGEIIGVPVEVAMTPSGLKEAIQQHNDKELIFIDTAGRSPYHDMHMSELKAFLDKVQPDLSILVMSATTQPTDQMKVFERFKHLTTNIIFSKLDETVCCGSILNLLQHTELPVAYLTNGQNVPDDIEIATPERLVHYILGEG